MKYTLKVTGMSCQRCVFHVTSAISPVSGVEKVEKVKRYEI